MLVIDASAAICLLAERPMGSVERVRDRLLGTDELHAPHLIDIEVTHALRRLVRLRAVTESQATGALMALAELPLIRHPHLPLLAAVWRIRDNRSAYDATYVALAETLGVPLITLDRRLARRPARVPIECFE